MRRLWAQRGWGADRIACAIAAFLVTALMGYALVMGLRAAPLMRALADNSPLALFNLKPPAPEKPEPVKPRPAAREGGKRASPAPSKREQKPDSAPPATIVAPAPVIIVPAPASPAAAPAIGAGRGAGGAGAGGGGNGRGSGGEGDGTGEGEGEGGAFSRARQTGGSFHNSDFPKSARGAGRLKIGVRYAIGPSGHVDKCEIVETSGYAEVDAMTCRVIVERYRFRPARDPDGYAVTEVREEDYRWRVRQE